MTWASTIVGQPLPKKNNMKIIPYKGRHIIVQGDKQTAWAKNAVLQVKASWHQKANKQFIEPVTVIARFYRADKRGDLDNLITSLGDVLQESGVILNDNLINGWLCHRFIDKKNPRIEFEITTDELG